MNKLDLSSFMNNTSKNICRLHLQKMAYDWEESDVRKHFNGGVLVHKRQYPSNLTRRQTRDSLRASIAIIDFRKSWDDFLGKHIASVNITDACNMPFLLSKVWIGVVFFWFFLIFL